MTRDVALRIHAPLRSGIQATVGMGRRAAVPLKGTVVDGLAASACGVLVTAIADIDRHDVCAVSRCAECQRIAG